MAETTQKEQAETKVAEPENTSVKKVELDLDDAPFLQVEEKKEVALKEENGLQDQNGDEAAKKKKRLILIGLILAALIGIGIAAWFIFGPKTPAPTEALKPEVIVVPSNPAPTQQPDLALEFAPFIVPVVDKQGQTRFLICKFSSISKDAAVNQEIQQNMLKLRDAIFYYLRNKNTDFLLDARNGDAIKKDLMSVFDDYLSHGQLEDIVFESYLNK